MIQQANYEFGFDVSDNPLMVEAIPLSSESLVLLITKVEYPEELDTRFSQFTEGGDEEELFSNMGAAGNVERKGADDILELFQKIREAKASPESENAQQTEAPEEVPEVPADLTKMFEFTTIDQVERLAHVLVNYYNGRNDLFKNEKKNRFYLVIHKDDHTPERMPCPSFCLRFDDLGTEKRYASWRYLMLSKAEQKLYRKHPALQIRRKDFNDTNQKIEVAYIFGADMMVKKKLFEQLGGFDEDFFMYAEEEELSWRIKKRGEKIYNIPQAKIIHLEGATLEKQHDFNEKQFKLRINGTMTYFWKRYGREDIYQFYKFRALRYQRLKKIAEIQKKSGVSFQFETRLRCLLECFEKIMEKTEGEGKKNGRS